MNKRNTQWQPLAQHGPWQVEYCREADRVRLQLGETTLQLEREAYQLLWGTLTEGLDALERVEDATGAGCLHGLQSQIVWPQTRH